MSGQRVLVTGASGVIGRRLLPALVTGEHEVFGLARSDRAAERVSELGAEPVLGDALDRGTVDSAVAEVLPSTIVHHATALSKPLANSRRIGSIFEMTNRIRSEGTRTWSTPRSATACSASSPRASREGRARLSTSIPTGGGLRRPSPRAGRS